MNLQSLIDRLAALASESGEPAKTQVSVQLEDNWYPLELVDIGLANGKLVIVVSDEASADEYEAARTIIDYQLPKESNEGINP